MSAIIVRRQPRSKGCEQCISRRIKCDERAGCCKKCARFGLRCSGAIRGAVFLDMTEKVSCSILKPQKRKKKRKERTTKAFITEGATKQYDGGEENRSLAIQSTPSNLGTTDEAVSSDLGLFGIEKRRKNDGNDMLYQPNDVPFSDFDSSQFSIIDTFNYDISIPPTLYAPTYNEYCFVGNFTQLIISSRRNYSTLRPQSWILELPHLLATNSLPSSLKYAMHAAALLYYAVAHHDIRAEFAAVKWYLSGIESYRTMTLGPQAKEALAASVRETQELGTSCISDIAIVCVPIMFSFYESLRSTNSDAELLHHEAATNMLEERGPDKCVCGLAHSVMRSLRVKEAFYSIMQNRSATFSSPEWLSIPFQQKHKICYDRLIDILLSFTKVMRLPSMNQRGVTLRNSIHRIHDLSTARKTDIEERAMALLAQLQSWWLEFREEHCGIMALGPKCPTASEATNIAVASFSSVLPLSGPWMIANSETLAASMVSIYSAAHIILHAILFIISLSRPPDGIGPDGQSVVNTHQSAISAYATNVFDASLYLDMINPFCGDAVRASFSINIVSQFALEDSQRDEARQLLNRWKVWGRGPPHFSEST